MVLGRGLVLPGRLCRRRLEQRPLVPVFDSVSVAGSSDPPLFFESRGPGGRIAFSIAIIRQRFLLSYVFGCAIVPLVASAKHALLGASFTVCGGQVRWLAIASQCV